MVLGAVISAVLAVTVFFVSKFIVFSARERISMAAIVGGGASISSGGFIVGLEVGFFVTGAMMALFGLLLAFENEGE